MESKIQVQPIDASIAKEEQQTALAMLSNVKGIVIADQSDYNGAAEDLQTIKGRLKWLEEKRKAITQPLDTAKKAVMELFRLPTSVYEEAEGSIKRAMLTFDQKEQRKRLELEAKMRREADKKRQELEAKAEAAREAGKEDKAQQYEEKAATIIEPVLAPTVDKPSGISFKELWRAEVIDFSKLPDSYKLPDMSTLNKVAQATKGTIEIAGVRFYSEKIVASRAQGAI